MHSRIESRANMKHLSFWIDNAVIDEVVSLQADLWPHQRASRTGIMRQCLDIGLMKLRSDVARLKQINSEEASQ